MAILGGYLDNASGRGDIQIMNNRYLTVCLIRHFYNSLLHHNKSKTRNELIINVLTMT